MENFAHLHYTSLSKVLLILNLLKYNSIHVYIHTHIDIYTNKQKCLHTYIHACIHTYKHTYIYTYIHTYIHAYIHTYIHTCIHTYTHTYMHTYVHTYIHTYMRIDPNIPSTTHNTNMKKRIIWRHLVLNYDIVHNSKIELIATYYSYFPDK